MTGQPLQEEHEKNQSTRCPVTLAVPAMRFITDAGRSTPAGTIRPSTPLRTRYTQADGIAMNFATKHAHFEQQTVHPEVIAPLSRRPGCMSKICEDSIQAAPHANTPVTNHQSVSTGHHHFVF